MLGKDLISVNNESMQKFEVNYFEPNVEKEIPDWAWKTIKSARVMHIGSDGILTVEFTDGTLKRYGYKEQQGHA
jgi:hypothetical protein